MKSEIGGLSRKLCHDCAALHECNQGTVEGHFGSANLHQQTFGVLRHRWDMLDRQVSTHTHTQGSVCDICCSLWTALSQGLAPSLAQDGGRQEIPRRLEVLWR